MNRKALTPVNAVLGKGSLVKNSNIVSMRVRSTISDSNESIAVVKEGYLDFVSVSSAEPLLYQLLQLETITANQNGLNCRRLPPPEHEIPLDGRVEFCGVESVRCIITGAMRPRIA